jgi:O-antigen ligase
MNDASPMPSPSSSAAAPTAVIDLPMHAAAATLAIAAPALVAFNLPPSATFLNQAVAVIGWAIWLMLIATSGLLGPMRIGRALASLLVGLGVVCAAAAVSWAQHLPGPLAASAIALIVAAAGAATVAATLSGPAAADTAFRALCIAMVVAGLMSVAIGIVQLFLPNLATGSLIAATSVEGRAVGNLRQPNHLSSLLLWSLVAAVWLGERRTLSRAAVLAVGALLVFGIVMTASRTGVAGIAVLVVWGLLDRRLSARSRLVLILLPLVYWLFWWGLAMWAHETQQVFGGERRFTADGDISSSRFAIWRDTLALIGMQPLWGVGFGEFNFAWSLTPFPQRPVAFFDHTHNLILQLVVELGVPLATLVILSLCYALLRGFVAAWRAPPASRGMVRAALVMVVMVAVHSEFEYPLWYAYFLLPTAFLFGLCAGADRGAGDEAAPARPMVRRAVQAAAALMLVGGVAAVADYHRVAAVFQADEGLPLAERIERGKRSWFFAHHAHYAAATIAERPSTEMASFSVATHYLLDTRLMMAWATALNESGDVERARHIAQRLREFRNADARPFFAPCDEPAVDGKPLPFQCTPPTRRFDYRDFLR